MDIQDKTREELISKLKELLRENDSLKALIESKEVEHKIRINEGRFDQLAEHSRVFVWEVDPNGLYTYVNHSCLTIMGYKPEEIIGKKHFYDLHPEQEREAFKEAALKVFASKESFHDLENAIQSSNGEIIWVLTNGIPILDDNGGLTGYRGSDTDITQRKQREEEIKEGKEKFRGLSEAAFEAIFFSEKGLCIEQNQAAETMFGYTLEEALGRSGTEWIVPEDREMVMKNMLSGHEEAYEARALRKDGTIFPCTLRGRMMHYKGRNVRVTALTDITRLKQSEEKLNQVSARLELAARAGGVGIWDYDIVNNILLWDDQMFALYGIERKDFSEVYEAWRSGIHPDDKERGDKEIQMAICGEKEFDTEFRVNWPDGSVHYIRALAVVQRNDSGKALRMIGTNWDITQFRIAEKVRLDDSENRYRSVFLGSPDGILIAYEQTKKIVFANPALCEMLGYIEDELKTMTFAGIHPADTLQNTLAEFESLAKGEKTLTENIQCFRKNGEIFYADIASSFMTINGRKCIVGFFRDITQRKQAEQEIRNLNANLELKVVERTAQLAISNSNLEKENAERTKVTIELQESLDRLNKIADRIPGVVFQYRLNPDGSSCFPFASKGIKDNYRVSPEEVAYDASIVFSKLHPDDFDGVIASIRSSARNLTLWQHDYRVKFEDGTIRWQAGNAMPQKEADGSVLWHGFISDITKREEMENSLRKSEAEKAAIIRAVPDLMFRIHRDGTLMDAYSRDESMLYATKEVFIGKKVNDVLPPDLARKAMIVIENVFTKGGAELFEYELAVQGKNCYFEDRIIAISDEEVLSIIRDITQRKEAENALKMQNAAFESFAFAIIITNIAGKIQWANSAFTQLTGYSVDEAIGKTPGELIKSGKQDKGFYKVFWGAILGKKVWTGELTNRRKDGSLYVEEETITPVLDSQGNISSFIAIKIDITERKALFQELADEKRRLADIIKGTNAGTWEWNIQTGKTIFNKQ